MTRHLRNFEVGGLLTEQGYRVTKSWVDAGDSGVLVIVEGDVAAAPPSTVGLAPTGALMPFAGSVAPLGWLLCDGTPAVRSIYAALFAVIGTTYGVGNGSTTFDLPNMKGRVPVGFDSTQTEFNALNSPGGEKAHLLITAEMPSHTHVQDSHNHTQNSHNHTQNAHTHVQNSHVHDLVGKSGAMTAPQYVSTNATDGAVSNRYILANGTINLGTSTVTAVNQDATATNVAATATNVATTATNQNTGGGGAHNILQPYIVLNYIIKT